MYFQDIVIHPNIFEKISKAFSLEYDEFVDMKSYVNNLNLKILILDKNEDEKSIVYDKLIKIMNTSSDLGKKMINDILRKFQLSERISFKEIKNGKNYGIEKISNQVLNLSVLSESKIVNSEDKSILDLKCVHTELEDIEFLNLEEFIFPPSLSKSISFTREINIPCGNEFRFENIFRPYLKETEMLVINDRYLRKKDRGYMVLCKILSLCKNLKNLSIYTLKRDGVLRDGFDMSLSDFKTSLEKQFPKVKSFVRKTNNTIGKDRFLETEHFRFKFSPGIDFVNEDYIADKNPISISIKFIGKTI